ncbi:MAG: AI-2E family transporter [Armatimonadetes bacterium]|nr:AI-2E family transporter [Armatimonadota bacterium]
MYTVQRYRRVVFAITCGLLAIAAVYVLAPFWRAFAWGIALAILVYPIHTRLNRRFSDSVAAGITTALALLFIIGPLALIVVGLFAEVNSVLAKLHADAPDGGGLISIAGLIQEANNLIAPIAQQAGIEGFDLKEYISQSIQPALGEAPLILQRVFFGIITFTFALLLLFFTLRDSHRLREPALDLIPLPTEESEAAIKSIYDTVHATFYGIVLVALAQGVVLGVTFWILGLPSPLLWGMASVVLCTIPFAGAPIIWVPTALVLAYQGEWGKGIAIALVGVLIIGLIDNIFRPIIIGARMNLHPIAVFFSLVGGILTLGPVGLLIGPVLLIVALGAIQVLRQMARSEIEEGTRPAQPP